MKFCEAFYVLVWLILRTISLTYLNEIFAYLLNCLAKADMTQYMKLQLHKFLSFLTDFSKFYISLCHLWYVIWMLPCAVFIHFKLHISKQTVYLRKLSWRKLICIGIRSCTVVWGTVLQAGRSRVRFLMRSLGIFIHVNLPATQVPGVDSATNINEYQGYLLGGKSGWCVGLITLPPSCVKCLEIPGASWSPKGLWWDRIHVCVCVGCYWYQRLIISLYMHQNVKLNLD
jgi:hypothetical protein